MPLEGRITGPDGVNRLQPKTMDVLLALAERRGGVVTREELLEQVWGGRAMSDDPLTRCIGDLRRALGDQRDEPVYIETIHKRGYKLMVPVENIEPASTKAADSRVAKKQALSTFKLAILLLATAALVGYLLLHWPDPGPASVSDANPTVLTNIRGELPAIAVLPFLNLSDQPVDSYLADGTAETLTQVLSRVDGLKVVARSSAFVFREAEDVRVIGDALQVDALLEGSVQKHGDVVRITTQLVATEDGRHLWSAAFDRPIDNLFAVQDEIATKVAAALQLTVLRDSDAKRGGTENFEAYREYLLGRERAQERTVDSIAEAVERFSRAMELDPDYALAHVGYADAVTLQHYYANRPLVEIEALARPALEKALELNPDLGEAYAALGILLDNISDIEGAENALQRAIALSPNYARAYFGYGTLFNDTGRPAEALPMHLRALELNPLAPHINNAVGVVYEKLGRFDEAMAQFERTMEVAPDYGAVRYRAGMLKWAVDGDAAAAKQLYDDAMAMDPGNPWGTASMVRFLMDLGDNAGAAKWLAVADQVGERFATGELKGMLLTRQGAPPAQRIEIARRFYDQSRRLGSTVRFIRIARDAYLEQNQPGEALALYREMHPELFESEVVINWLNFMPAVDLALVLSQTSERRRRNCCCSGRKRTSPIFRGWVAAVTESPMSRLRRSAATWSRR